MSETPNELAEEFPDFLALMRHLQQIDGHFAQLCRRYEDLDRRIFQAQTRSEPADANLLMDMCKTRMRLKDEIYGMLVQPEPEAEAIKLAV
ncbi:YdcH family protein [Rhizobium panacihumi]|uniref:YdcH family protein n=1 Tax=Rhizobium panacihumi TaxID=2008450 RepID=UPI003D7A459E